MKSFFNSIFLFMLSLSLLFQPHFMTAQPLESLVKINIQNKQQAQQLIHELRLDVTDVQSDFIKAIVTQQDIARLKHKGVDFEIKVADMAHQLDWLAALPNFGDYHTYDELVADLFNLSVLYPTITFLDTIGYSVQGRVILALKITDSPQKAEVEPEVRIIGCHHGNEVISVEVAYYLAEYLVSNYATDSRIRNLVNNREIWIVPMLNPDGHVAGNRYNANWVDINRDYGYMWDGSGSSPAPFSQPETQAIYEFSQGHNFCLSLTHHSGAEYVNYLWNYTPILTPDNDLVVDIANGYSSYSGYTTINGWQWYETHGDCNDFSYGIDSSVDYTIEISNSYAPPTSQIDYYCERNLEAQLYLIDKAGQGIRGVVTDAVTGDTLTNAVIDIAEVHWPVFCDPVLGDYQRVLLPGTYTVKAWANGYQTQTVEHVTVTENSRTTVDIALSPAGGYYAYKLVHAIIPDPNYPPDDETLTVDALGAADSVWVSLGKGGEISLDMGASTPIVDEVGDDFFVAEGDLSPEGYFVSVSNVWNGPWTLLGTGLGSTNFDLHSVGMAAARYVRIEDDDDGDPYAQFAGFDLDAIVSLHPPTGLKSIRGKINYLSSQIPVSDATLSLSGHVTDQTVSDGNGEYVFWGLPDGYNYIVTPSKTNDCAPLTISAYDASLALQISLGIFSPTAQQFIAADADENGRVLAQDAGLIARQAVGLPPIAGSAAGQWRFDPTSRSYEPLAMNQIDQDFSSLVIGDVDGDWEPATNPKPAVQKEIAILRNLVGCPNQVLSLPIFTDQEKGILSCDLALNFDPRLLSFIGVRMAPAFENFSVATRCRDSGKLRLAMYGGSAIESGGELFHLDFRIIGAVGKSCDLQLKQLAFNGGVSYSDRATLAIRASTPDLPTHYALLQNYPNPFGVAKGGLDLTSKRLTTTIEFLLPRDDYVDIAVFDVLGRKIKTLVSEKRAAGVWREVWDGRNDRGQLVTAGVYFVRMTAKDFHANKKLICIAQ